MHTKSCLLLLVIISLIGNGCQKNSHEQPVTDPLSEKVVASLSGRVTDENGKPVNNASVESGGSNTTTDINGFFRVANIQLAKNGGFVIAEKSGYFKGCRTIFTNAGVINNIEIQLIPKTNRGNFSASAGGTISIQNGSSVNFPAGGIINAGTNATYTGSVNVFGAYLDPTNPKLSLMMPGNLTGLTTNNEQALLQTFGMMAVELEGANGEKLNIATGKTAVITMPIPSSLSPNAPATIPLWFFDETKGLWKQEGSANKQGSAYVGTVSHFSFWNCDVPNNFIRLKLTLKDQNGQAGAGYRVELKDIFYNSSAYAITDSTGVASGAVRPGTNFQLDVYNKCNTLLHSQTIGPFSTNTDLGVITITAPTPANITLSGTVRDCSLSTVTTGYTDVILDGLIYRTAITNGLYSITINRCSGATTTAQIIATDLQTNQQSASTSVTVTSGNYPNTNVIACGVSTLQYINYTIGGNAQNFVSPADSFATYRQNPTTTIQAFPKAFTDSASWQYTSFGFDGVTSPGTYALSPSFIVSKGFHVEYAASGPITVTITEFGSTGQYISGSFSGTMRERYTAAIVSGSCNFRVRRNF